MNNIILIGMKSCGKTAVGKLLAEKLNQRFIDLDEIIERLFAGNTKRLLPCREIMELKGEEFFRKLETGTLKSIIRQDKIVLATGGGTPLSRINRKLLRSMGKIIFIDTISDVLASRIIIRGIPEFFPDKDNPKSAFDFLFNIRRPIYEKLADHRIPITGETPEEIVKIIIRRVNV